MSWPLALWSVYLRRKSELLMPRVRMHGVPSRPYFPLAICFATSAVEGLPKHMDMVARSVANMAKAAGLPVGGYEVVCHRRSPTTGNPLDPALTIGVRASKRYMPPKYWRIG